MTRALMRSVAGRFAESGRPDDNPESFKVRLDAYNSQTAPLLPYYDNHKKLVEKSMAWGGRTPSRPPSTRWCASPPVGRVGCVVSSPARRATVSPGPLDSHVFVDRREVPRDFGPAARTSR